MMLNRWFTKRNAILIALIAIISTQFLTVFQVHATPILPIGTTTQAEPFESSPTAGTSSGIGTVSQPISNAYDGDWDTQCNFYYGFGDGYLELSGFTNSSTVNFNIGWVDFKINYKADGSSPSTDEQYRIIYYVGDSPTLFNTYILQDWVSGAQAKFNYYGAQSNQAWSNQYEPNDFVWDWADLGNVKVRIETDQVTTNHLQTFSLYEVWLSVYPSTTPLPPTGVSIQPPFVNVTAGEVFFIDVYVVDAVLLWGYQFKISYDTNVLTAREFYSYYPFTDMMPSQINDTAGYVTLAFSSYMGDTIGFSGNKPLIRIYFLVDAQGKSNLHFETLKLVNTAGDQVVVNKADGSFDNRILYAPVASFTWAPNIPYVGENVTFDASASYDTLGTIVSYAWNFGDGQTSTASVTTHAYTDANIYTVILIVTDNDGMTGFAVHDVTVLTAPPAITINPSLGPVGTKVTVEGSNFMPETKVELKFDDQGIGFTFASINGTFTAILNVPVSEAGVHAIKAVAVTNTTAEAMFVVTETTPLDLQADVGTIHFRGEQAEFYVQTAFKGTPIDITSLTTTLHIPNGSTETLTTQKLATGLYKASYAIPTNAPTGTYVLVAEASYLTSTIDSKGTTIKSFLLSPTLTGWNALLISINETMATIKTDVGLLTLDIDAINLNVTAINGVLATVKTDVGTITGKITAMQGDVATIKTDVGTIKTTIKGWTGATVSDIVTQTGTFNLLALTTSQLDNLAFSDNTITIVVSGATGTSGKTNVVIPKQFLVGIGSDIAKVGATLNDKQVDYELTDNTETYVLSLGYTHSTETIKIYLTGIPQQTLLPLMTILMIIAAILIATSMIAIYMKRLRKKPTKP